MMRTGTQDLLLAITLALSLVSASCAGTSAGPSDVGKSQPIPGGLRCAQCGAQGTPGAQSQVLQLNRKDILGRVESVKRCLFSVEFSGVRSSETAERTYFTEDLLSLV